MTDKPVLEIVVTLSDDTKHHWYGDVEMHVSSDGILNVYSYDVREAYPNMSGLVLASGRGAWKTALVQPVITARSST